MKLSKILKPKFKSEFTESDLTEIFNNHNYSLARMIGGSKSGYIHSHPKHVVVFNGNIITKSHGKVWFGDINITLDRSTLELIAREIGEDLFILREHDARVENESKPFKFYKDKAVDVIKAE